jgi:hypothetical protein
MSSLSMITMVPATDYLLASAAPPRANPFRRPAAAPEVSTDP